MRIRNHKSLNNILACEFQRQCISLGAWGREGGKEGEEQWYPSADNAAVSVTAFLPGDVEDGTTGRGSRSLLHILITREVALLAACCLQL